MTEYAWKGGADAWIVRVYRERRAGNLTANAVLVLSTLRTYRGCGGLICPSHATLAERAGCNERTVRRALARARELGLVQWFERRVRAAWRWLRTSNRYLLTVPAEPVQPAPSRAPVFSKVSPPRAECPVVGKKRQWAEVMVAAAQLPDLLAARRAAFSLAQRQKGC